MLSKQSCDEDGNEKESSFLDKIGDAMDDLQKKKDEWSKNNDGLVDGLIDMDLYLKVSDMQLELEKKAILAEGIEGLKKKVLKLKNLNKQYLYIFSASFTNS